MFQQQVLYLINVLMVVDGMIVIGCGYLAAYLRWLESGRGWSIGENLLIGIILFLMFVNNFAMGKLGLYSDRRSPSIFFTIQRTLYAVIIDFSILTIALYTLKIEGLSRLFILIYAGLALVLFLLCRLIFEVLMARRLSKSFNARQVLLVGSDQRAERVFNALMSQKSWGHEVVGYLKPTPDAEEDIKDLAALGVLSDLEELVTNRNVDEIFFVLPPDSKVKLKGYLHFLEEVGVAYRIVPAMYDHTFQRPLVVESIQNIPTISRSMARISPAGLLQKRLLDIAGGMAGVLFVLLIYPFVALAIKLDSPGPVFFRQARVGMHGRVFTLLKFRSMRVDADEIKQKLMKENEMKGLMFKMAKDPRVTRVGRFLRKTSLDEFPQFFNVLKGEMSLVGTRPPTLDEVERYEYWHRRRISTKPGLTGLWQISGRNAITDFNEVVRLDLQYIDQWSLMNDLKILLKTAWVVLCRKGAH